MKRFNLLILCAATALTGAATDLNKLKIYVNPGHGGYDSDDRNVVVPPFKQGDHDGFYESKSNLVKGFAIRDLLTGFGADVMMSRTTNTTADDRDLHEIGYEANAYGADFFFSIHSNATGNDAVKKNQPLMLFRGYTADPVSPAAKAMSAVLNKHLLENRITSWSSEAQWLAGDFNFYPDWNNAGLGVLRKLTVPGMLSEGSYHDYIPETYRLLNNEYCWLEGYHFVKAVMEYFETPQKFTTGVVGGTLTDSRLVRTDPVYGKPGIFFGHDKALPLQGATVQLCSADGATVIDTYTTDNLSNGVYLFKAVAPGTYKLKFSHPDYNAKEAEVTVTANNVTYENVSLDRIRNTAPQVESYSPLWKEGDEPVLCNTRIELNFNWDMDTESVEKNFSITPAVAGKITWEDSQYRMVFTPDKALDLNTIYTVRLGKDAKHPGGIAMGKDFEFSFLSGNYNQLEILANSPSEGERVHYASPILEFRFAQLPDVSQIQNEITITDNSGNKVPYNVRTKKFSSKGSEYGFFQIKTTKNFEVGKTYNVNVASTVCDQNGMKIAAPMNYEFTAVDASAIGNGRTLLESLDEDGILADDATNAANVESFKVSRTTSSKLEGSAAVQLTYTFSGQEGGQVSCSFRKELGQTFGNTRSLGVKVYGDLSRNTLYAHFAKEGDGRKVKVAELSWLGWHDVAVDLTALPDDGYELAGFSIEQTGGQISRKGTVVLDALTIGASSGVEEVAVSGVRVYPNPASELLIANANALISGVELFTSDGRVVAKASGNVLNVSAIPAGNYLLRISVAGGSVVKKVVIKH